MRTGLKIATSTIFIIIFITLGFSAFFYLKTGLIKLIHSKLEIRNDSLLFKDWKDIPLPIYNKVYFFNVSNANEIMEHGAKPVLNEIGPFTYRLYLNKTYVVFNDNGTVTYREKKTWMFEPHLSVASQDFRIITLNTPLAAALTLIEKVPPIIRTAIALALDRATEGFFIERSIRELMFEGYPDAFAALGPLISPELAKNKGKFGYFWPKNGTDDGLITAFTGKNSETMMLIDRYNGKPHLDTWLTEECNRINDSSQGELRPPLDHPLQIIKIFQPLVCRPFFLNFTEPFVTKAGFKTYKYELDKNMFRNASEFPPNACYESKIPTFRDTNLVSTVFNILSGPTSQKHKKLRFPNGVIDLSACFFGAPVLMSYPHFLNADPYYLRTVDGLKPNKSLHDIWFAVEPITGGSVDLSFGFQLNVHINRPAGLIRYRHIPEIVFPALWQKIEVEWPEDFASKLNLVLNLPTITPIVVFVICLSVSGIFITVLFHTLYRRSSQKACITKRAKVISVKQFDFSFAKIIACFLQKEDTNKIVASDVNQNEAGVDNLAASIES
ncbi:scavenger receptor class B member 1-like protein [Dinothrombium tinctorium]|uniref:Scavenger receptor class B member 1 n=1 Tax=Dinothrombium tinctorium TaxID=1965070 RepID=A0A443QUV5_9ACAR|nr:scavenger receptor class B member 1-like protein [Dinothrombium tinctorium]